MTDKEKAIVMAYTGVCMLSGDKFQIFHKYIEDIMGRPVYIHELADKVVEDEIKEKAKADFIALCEDQESILDKIRTEIESKCCITVGRENDGAITLHDVFEIIDKYKAESEET